MLDREIECTASCRRLVKRKRDLVETNPPRNSQLKLIEADGAEGGHSPASSVVPNIGFDRFPYLRNSSRKLPRSGLHDFPGQLCLELNGRPVAQCRVQAFLVVDLFEK